MVPQLHFPLSVVVSAGGRLSLHCDSTWKTGLQGFEMKKKSKIPLLLRLFSTVCRCVIYIRELTVICVYIVYSFKERFYKIFVFDKKHTAVELITQETQETRVLKPVLTSLFWKFRCSKFIISGRIQF